MFTKLKSIFKRCKVKKAIFDFEQAAFIAFKEVFPKVEIIGCLFHFGQTIYRNVQRLGYQKTDENNEEYSEFVKMLISLTFVPPNDVLYAFKKLKRDKYYKTNHESLSELFTYFENNWMQDVLMWNHYESVIANDPRTNNVSEAWHSSFSRRLQATHLNIWKFINELKIEQALAKTKLSQREAGDAPPVKNENIDRMISA